MVRYTQIALLLLMPLLLMAQPGATIKEPALSPAEIYAGSITATDLETYLTILASDDMEGRETGTEGQRKAADYIAERFAEFGLPTIGENGTYFQKIAYTAVSWMDIQFFVGKNEYRHLWDYYSFPGTNAHRPTASSSEVIFLGYGIDDPAYSDYRGVDVRGKTILVYPGEPISPDSISYVTGSRELSEWSTNYRKKLEAAYQNGVETILLIDADIKKSIADNRRLMLSPRLRIGEGEQPENKYANNIFISSTIAADILGRKKKKVIKARDKILATGSPQNVKLKRKLDIVQDKRIRQILGSNVLGYIEGSDPAVKDEVVVVTAHYDHLGRRQQDIYNGADDNGSGTSSVIEVTQALAKAKAEGKGPRRSVLCMLVSGEEKGLLGSKYYVENPIFPLEQTVADVNVDMVGRVDQKHAEDPNYIYVIGSDRLSTELHSINELMNQRHTQLELDYTYNAENDPNRYYYRSDHYNFAERNIPSIFYFNGTHADYHQITDTVDKINFAKMEKIARLVFHVTWELANREDRIQVDVSQP